MNIPKQWYITVKNPEGDCIEIIGTGTDPQSPAGVTTRARGARAEGLLAEIRDEVLYPPQEMVWALHSRNDLYGWHAAVGAVIDRRRERDWVIDHNLP